MWQKRLVQKRIPDLYLLTLICCLVILGMFMVYSSSHIWSEYKYGDSFFYVKRQMIFTVVGIICMRSEERRVGKECRSQMGSDREKADNEWRQRTERDRCDG